MEVPKSKPLKRKRSVPSSSKASSSTSIQKHRHLQAEAEEAVRGMASDNDDNLSQRQLDYEVTWSTILDKHSLHDSSQTFNHTRVFNYEAWHNSQNTIISKYAKSKGYTAYPPTYVPAILTCSKKNEIRKFSIREPSDWDSVEAILDRWSNLKLKNLVVKLENKWSRHPLEDDTSEESSVRDDVLESEADNAPPKKKSKGNKPLKVQHELNSSVVTCCLHIIAIRDTLLQRN